VAVRRSALDFSMRDLLADPLWRAEDVGRPLPDSPHACSVCLPTWRDVIGYEECDSAVISRLQSGYPRFFCHPQVSRLFKLAETSGPAGEKAFVFPSREAAETAARFIGVERARDSAEPPGEDGGPRRNPVGPPEDGGGPRRGSIPAVVPLGDTPLWRVSFNREQEKRARLVWRFCGQIVSSRLAEAVLENWPAGKMAEIAKQGACAEDRVRERLSALTGQPKENIFLLASGMAGVFAVHRALEALFPGCRTVQLGFPYVDVLKVQEEFGAGVHFIEGVGEREVAALGGIAASERLAGIFTELPSNPLIECADLEAVAGIAREHEMPLICDDTLATAVNVDVFQFADVVTTSLTKAFSGAGDVMAGSVIVGDSSPWRDRLRSVLAREVAAAPLFGADAVVLEENSRDFAARVGQMNGNAAAMASFLRDHPAVERVYYPTIGGSSAYDRVRRPGGGYGMVLSFTLHEKNATPGVFDRLRVCKGPSLGTNFTLACPYTLLAHYNELDWAESCGVSRHLVRVSVGLENPDDLQRRFHEALTG
jgi:cystathionine gamma-synthase